jgi:hypothetical protein
MSLVFTGASGLGEGERDRIRGLWALSRRSRNGDEVLV